VTLRLFQRLKCAALSLLPGSGALAPADPPAEVALLGLDGNGAAGTFSVLLTQAAVVEAAGTLVAAGPDLSGTDCSISAWTIGGI
jgi:hypothetical protein